MYIYTHYWGVFKNLEDEDEHSEHIQNFSQLSIPSVRDGHCQYNVFI